MQIPQLHRSLQLFPILAFAGMLWALPLGHIDLLSRWTAHDYSRAAELIVLVLAAVAWARHKPTDWFGAKAWWLMGCLASLLGAVCAHAAHPVAAAREVALMGGLVVLALALSDPLTEASVRDRVLDVLAVGSAVYGAVWLITFLMAGFVSSPFVPWNLLIGFDNPRFLNHAQSVALPLAGVTLLRESSPRWLRRTAAFALFSGGAILSFYLARASILALLAGAIVAVLVVGRPSRRYVASMVFWLTLGAVAVGVAWMARYRFLVVEPMTDGILNVHFRDYLASRAFDFFLMSPWVGIGPMHFAQSLNPIAAHSHNIYVQTLAEYGLPATLLLLWLVLRGLRMAVGTARSMRTTQPVLAAALMSSMVAMLVDGAFSGNFVMPLSQMWCATLVGLLIAQGRAARAPSEDGMRMTESVPRSRLLPAVVWRWSVAAALLLAMCLAMGEFLDPDGPRIHTGEPKKVPISDQIFNPRFWAHGWF